MRELSIEINNLAGLEFEESFFEKVAEDTLKSSGVDCLKEKEISISVALVSEEEISGINKRYRQKDCPTDVLSFSEYAKIEELCDNGSEEVFLGEIIICPDYLEKSAKEQGVSFEFELAYIFSHGILHLLDFSHGEEMFSLQERVAKKNI